MITSVLGRHGKKRAFFVCVVFVGLLRSETSWKERSETTIPIDATATRASAPQSPKSRVVEVLRNVSRRTSGIEKFDFALAQSKFQSILNATGALNAPTLVSCGSAGNESARAFGDDFSGLLTWASAVRRDSRLVHRVKSATPRVFIAGLLHNSCELMHHYVVEVLKFIFIYGDDENFENVLISLYSSGDGDCTTSTLEAFKELLDVVGVPNAIETRGRQRTPGVARIDFLQSIRNAVMKPLYLSGQPFNEVIFLSDAFFCAGDIVRLLRHTEASIKCGLDFDGTTNAMKFRDTWVAHDMSGRMFTKEFPYAHDVVSSNALNDGSPFQVSCCWNGLLTLRANVFTDLGARFRRSLDETECHASETELICHDFAALGYSKMLIDPQVTVTYTKAEYIALSNSHSDARSYSRRWTNLFANESIDTLKTWLTRPSSTECAPLDGHEGDHPDRGRTYQVNWNNHYGKVGVPVASEKKTVSLHICTGPAANQCSLIGAKRVPASSTPDAPTRTP